MVIVKTGTPSKKEFQILQRILQEYIDTYRDFYITRDNLRLFIRENFHLLKKCLKQGDKIAFDEKRGIAFVTGFSDKAERKYLKILYNEITDADLLLKALSHKVNCDLWIKIKKNNTLIQILKRNGFEYFKNRGKEVLYYRKIKIY